jgi:hypothetical protein
VEGLSGQLSLIFCASKYPNEFPKARPTVVLKDFAIRHHYANVQLPQQVEIFPLYYGTDKEGKTTLEYEDSSTGLMVSYELNSWFKLPKEDH